MIKCFIFDFDGVIADTESIWFDLLVDFAKSENLDTDEKEMATFVGDGDTSVMDHLANKLGGRCKLDEKLPSIRERFREKTQNLSTRDGLLDYLDFAQKNCIKLAVASSSARHYIDYWLSRLGIDNQFDVVVTKDDATRIKPSPDIYLAVLERLNLPKGEVVAFEDSAIGCKAAEAAGILCVLVPNRASGVSTAKLPNTKLDMAATPPHELFKAINN